MPMPHQCVFVYMSVKYAILRWKNQTSVQSADMSITLDKIVNHSHSFCSVFRRFGVFVLEKSQFFVVYVCVSASVDVWFASMLNNQVNENHNYGK